MHDNNFRNVTIEWSKWRQNQLVLIAQKPVTYTVALRDTLGCTVAAEEK